MDQDPEKKDQVRDRHCEYFAEFVHQREADIRGGDHGEILAEMDNIRSGLQWAITREKIPEIRKQIQSLFLVYQFQGWLQEAKATFEGVERALGTDAPIGEKGIAFGEVLSILGDFSYKYDQEDEGAKLLRKSRAILRQLDAQMELAWSTAVLGRWCRDLDYSEATQYFEESIAIYEKKDLQWGIAFTHNCWGDRTIFARRYEEAERHYREAVQINDDLNNRNDKAWYFSGVGFIALMRGEYQKAMKFLEEGYLAFKAVDNKMWAATRLMDIGDVALLMGDFEEAETRHLAALSIRRGIGNQGDIAISIADLGNVALGMGEYELAKYRFQEALARFQNLGDQRLVSMVFRYLGNLALAMGDPQEVRGKYHSAMKIGAAT